MPKLIEGGIVKGRGFKGVLLVFVLVSCLTTTSPGEGTITISGQYDIAWITPDTHEYCVQNDVWNPESGWVQVLEVNDQNGDFTVKQANHNRPATGAPASYPSIFRGNHWGTATNNSGTPIRVKDIRNVITSWEVTVTDSGIWNAAYEIWFHKTGDYSGGAPNGAELMIWINWQGLIQPSGSRIDIVSLANNTWEVWFADLEDWDYIAYRRTDKTTSISFDINEFIKDALSRGRIENSWYFISVEAGFELWQGGAGLKSSGFSVTVNSGEAPGINILLIGAVVAVAVVVIAIKVLVGRRRETW